MNGSYVFDPIPKACDKVITGGMVSCGLGKLHLECVICSACKKSIGKVSWTSCVKVVGTSCLFGDDEDRYVAANEKGLLPLCYCW